MIQFIVIAGLLFLVFLIWLTCFSEIACFSGKIEEDKFTSDLVKNFYRDINRPPYTSITSFMKEEERWDYSERQYEKEMRTRNEEREKSYSEEKLEWLESHGVVTERMKRKQELEQFRNRFGIPSDRYE